MSTRATRHTPAVTPSSDVCPGAPRKASRVSGSRSVDSKTRRALLQAPAPDALVAGVAAAAAKAKAKVPATQALATQALATQAEATTQEADAPALPATQEDVSMPEVALPATQEDVLMPEVALPATQEDVLMPEAPVEPSLASLLESALAPAPADASARALAASAALAAEAAAERLVREDIFGSRADRLIVDDAWRSRVDRRVAEEVAALQVDEEDRPYLQVASKRPEDCFGSQHEAMKRKLCDIMRSLSPEDLETISWKPLFTRLRSDFGADQFTAATKAVLKNLAAELMFSLKEAAVKVGAAKVGAAKVGDVSGAGTSAEHAAAGVMAPAGAAAPAPALDLEAREFWRSAGIEALKADLAERSLPGALAEHAWHSNEFQLERAYLANRMVEARLESERVKRHLLDLKAEEIKLESDLAKSVSSAWGCVEPVTLLEAVVKAQSALDDFETSFEMSVLDPLRVELAMYEKISALTPEGKVAVAPLVTAVKNKLQDPALLEEQKVAHRAKLEAVVVAAQAAHAASALSEETSLWLESLVPRALARVASGRRTAPLQHPTRGASKKRSSGSQPKSVKRARTAPKTDSRRPDVPVPLAADALSGIKTWFDEQSSRYELGLNKVEMVNCTCHGGASGVGCKGSGSGPHGANTCPSVSMAVAVIDHDGNFCREASCVWTAKTNRISAPNGPDLLGKEVRVHKRFLPLRNPRTPDLVAPASDNYYTSRIASACFLAFGKNRQALSSETCYDPEGKEGEFASQRDLDAGKAEGNLKRFWVHLESPDAADEGDHHGLLVLVAGRCEKAGLLQSVFPYLSSDDDVVLSNTSRLTKENTVAIFGKKYGYDRRNDFQKIGELDVPVGLWYVDKFAKPRGKRSAARAAHKNAAKDSGVDVTTDEFEAELKSVGDAAFDASVAEMDDEEISEADE